MKEVFVLGRNPELSKLEIFSYLDARGIVFEELFFDNNVLIVNFNSEEEIDVQELGGCLRTGKILFSGNEEGLINHIYEDDLINSEKFSYGVFGNVDEGVFKEKFKNEKRKAVLKNGRNRIRGQGGENFKLPNADIYFFIGKGESGEFYFAILDKEYNYEDVKKRDMKKPVRREELAISPRLSKILINLAGAEKGSLLLDPFCGIGGVLMEALVKEVNVYGVDKDAAAVKGCLKNFTWLKKEFKIRNHYIVERRDAVRILNKEFDAIATETPLGRLVKHRPKKSEAVRIVKDFERMITPILFHLKNVKKADARIAITFPRIKDVKVDCEAVCEASGLKIIAGPIYEAREKQFIGRDIVVFA